VTVATPKDFAHRPVMEAEILKVLEPVPSGVVLDATLGAGGHSEAILKMRDDLQILGLDQDPAAPPRGWRTPCSVRPEGDDPSLPFRRSPGGDGDSSGRVVKWSTV
jgi:hypothetical protein